MDFYIVCNRVKFLLFSCDINGFQHHLLKRLFILHSSTVPPSLVSLLNKEECLKKRRRRRMFTQTVSLHTHSCCKFIALKKEWESLGLKKQENLCMCSSPDFYVFISRASSERSVILVFFCNRLHSH